MSTGYFFSRTTAGRNTGLGPFAGRHVGGNIGPFGGHWTPPDQRNQGGPATPPDMPNNFAQPNPSQPVTTTPGTDTGSSINENSYYDALLARRRRSAQSGVAAGVQQLQSTLASRGLLNSGGFAQGVLGLQAQANQEVGNAAVDIYGQQFAAQQQREAEQRAFERQLQLSNLSFEQQASLLRLQAELSGNSGGNWLGRIVRGIGGAAAGWLTGGPVGAIAGGASGFAGG